MSVPLDLQSEPFSATGGAAAEGVSNQLGRPRADRFTLLVREAAQNSWDARLASADTVQFHIDGYVLGREDRRELARLVFAEVPTSIDVRERLLDEVEFPVLAVSDYGTSGLSGATRGDIVPPAGESTNFVDFMRYIGRPPNRAYAGGTYGFGKAAYFLASSLKTICVHTRFHDGMRAESRFMAAALGPQFETEGSSGRRFTGRHWWGRKALDHVVDPLVGDEADRINQLLGSIGRSPGATGTTVYVLAPDFQGDAPETVLAQMSRTIADYFWPKTMDGPSGAASMAFCVRWRGKELPLPIDPALALFAEAFAAVSSSKPASTAHVGAIASQRPRKHLGQVALVRKPAAPSRTHSTAAERETFDRPQRAFTRPLHHVAVMRAPNFVVKYLEGPPVPYDLAEYGGVFRVDHEVDAAFARAEPPTHDDWVPDLLIDAAEKTYVRVAHRRLKEEIEAFATPNVIEPSDGGTESLAGFAHLLGGLVPSVHRQAGIGVGSGRESRGARNERGGRSVPALRVAFVGDPTTELVDGVPAMLAKFEVTGPERQSVQVTAIPRVVVADGFETEPPEGSEVPRILAWLAPDGRSGSVGAVSCSVLPGSGVWTVAVSIPTDAMIEVRLTASAAGDL